jgi:PRC-barrel domain
MTLSVEQLEPAKGADVTSGDGHPVGTVEGIYLDESTREPEWALVNTPWIGQRNTCVPLREATLEQGTLRVPYSLEQLRGAPTIDPDGSLSEGEEAELYSYYGIPYPHRARLRITRYYDVFPDRQLWS